jgi:hypothetical protein
LSAARSDRVHGAGSFNVHRKCYLFGLVANVHLVGRLQRFFNDATKFLFVGNLQRFFNDAPRDEASYGNLNAFFSITQAIVRLAAGQGVGWEAQF